MRRRRSAEQGEASPLAIKVAWWAGFFATLVLVFALAQAKDAHAATTLAPAVAQTAEDEAEDPRFEEEWEAEEEECEVLGEDEEEACEEATAAGPPADCVLTAAKATVTLVPARSVVRVAIAYTARTAASVRVELSLRGARGPLRLGEDRARFGRTGTFHGSERLNERELAKALAARSFSVDVGAVNAPRSCHGLDRRLSVRRAVGGALTWSEPPARARSGRG